MSVMGQPHDLLEEFPAELAERLQRMAEVQTAGSSPWPGVDRAVQRALRRRVAGVATFAATSVLVVGFALGGMFDPGSNRSHSVVPIATTPPAVLPTTTTTSTETSVAKTVRLNGEQVQAAYTGAVGGSLAKDRAWQGALRNRLAHKFSLEEPQGPSILLLWAGDVNGSRYAVALVRTQPPGQTWMSVLGAGPAGASAGQMEVRYKPGMGVPETGADFLNSKVKAAPFAGTVFVKAPRAATIEVATARSFSPDGTVTTTWRPLKKQGGSVWVGDLSAAELHLADYRVDGTVSGGARAVTTS
jgi:hypothetical protein